MAQKEHPPAKRSSLALTRQDVVLIVALIGVLALGLIPAWWLVSIKPDATAISPPVPTPTIPTKPTQTQAVVVLVTPTLPSMTSMGLAETATSTGEPTRTPVVPIMTPTVISTEPSAPPATEAATAAPSPTSAPSPAPAPDTPTPSRMPATTTPTSTLSRTATASPTPTATPAPAITQSPAINATTNTPSPEPKPSRTPVPATVVYVQSNGQTHELGIVTSRGSLINDKFHEYAGAPAWSPDGKTIAFFGELDIRRLGGVYEKGEGLWAIGVNGENPRRLFGIDRVLNVAWSPDGKSLAFETKSSSVPAHQIVVTDPDGNEQCRFNGEQPAWTSDSQKLVIKACNSACGLWRVSLQGAFEEQLTTHKNDSFPTLSLDGRYMAFSSNRDEDWEIYLLSLDTLDLTRLTERPGIDTTPVFSPDSQHIYLRTSAFRDWRITVMALDGSNEQVVKASVGPSDDWGMARPALH